VKVLECWWAHCIPHYTDTSDRRASAGMMATISWIWWASGEASRSRRVLVVERGGWVTGRLVDGVLVDCFVWAVTTSYAAGSSHVQAAKRAGRRESRPRGEGAPTTDEEGASAARRLHKHIPRCGDVSSSPYKALSLPQLRIATPHFRITTS
jgi:hypothetical protein